MLPEPIPLKPPTPQAVTATGITHPRHPGGPARFLTDVIVDLGLVERERVASAVEEGRRTGKMPEQVLIEQGALTADGLSRAVAERHGLDHLDLGIFKPDMAAANLISIPAAKRYEAVPVGFLDDRTLLVAMADPANVLAVDDIALLTGKEIRPAVTSRDDILNLISRLSQLDDVVTSDMYDDEEDEVPADIVDLRESAGDAPVIRLVNQIVAQAVEQGASDIHLEPNGHELRVRFRIDGVLIETATVQRRMVLGVISRVKIMSDLDISERRIPQDGRVGLTIDGHHIDLRVVTLPSVHGESVVIRILDKSAIVMELEKLGMAAPERKRFERAFHQSFGAVLVTGPTGSGKSTTLYAALAALNTIEKNIITIEDPVEYQLEGITQVQVNPKAGLHFHTGLRSMMRADPDIIMVGEIRDRETAQIAIESALTGHLVLSTLHTNDAASAVTRLVDMGVEPFLVASAIDCVVAQRLARKLCPHCKQRGIITAEILRANGIRSQFDMEAYQPTGCPRCNHTGYKGRIGLYEVMVISEELRKLTLARAAGPEIAEVAVRQGMRLMRDDGLEKVRHGMTSIEEIARVVGTGADAAES
ncbi:MAG: Flp pilus assembly complex ATPase component TadA [Solirubrobacterales bacterium]|nr:Flp pilus assembly complex ATPase component TadA [Solirubrobacterales bacterium]